ncbi:MAG: hypothetical protein ACI94Y_001962 [Maribacter sp.]|jgi:hypothetical protein
MRTYKKHPNLAILREKTINNVYKNDKLDAYIINCLLS